MEEHTEEAQSEEEAARLPVMLRFLPPYFHPNPVPKVKIAVYGSLISNIALCVLQSELKLPCLQLALTTKTVYAAVSSLSLSLLATGIDSVFDIGSNVVLFWLHKKAQTLDSNKWPVGGSRLETIGNIVYGTFLEFGNPRR